MGFGSIFGLEAKTPIVHPPAREQDFEIFEGFEISKKSTKNRDNAGDGGTPPPADVMCF